MALRKRGKSRSGDGQDPGFLASIVAEPDDDTRRLAYADWLEEHDQPERAEIIRVQCTLARLRYDDDDVSSLQAREHRLLSRHLPQWREEMGIPYAGFRRGFVEWFPSYNPHEFLAGADKLFAAHPIRDLGLGSDQFVEAGWGAEAAACSHLSRIETLCLVRDRSCGTELSDFVAVLSSPHLTNLTTLDAGGGHNYGDDFLRELLETADREGGRKGVMLPSLRKLRRLSLRGMGITDDGVRMLAHSPLAETLTGLDLSGGPITRAGISALVKSPLWPQLEELNLSWNTFHDAESLRLLFSSLRRSRIRRLGLQNREWSGLAKAMAGARSWGSLEALDLGSVGLTNEGLRLLAQSKQLSGMRWLALGNQVNNEGLRDLAGCPHAAGLTALWLNGCQALTDRGMRHLADSPYLTGLVYLNIDCTRVRDKGVADFLRSPNAARLRYLELPGNLGDETYEAIATSPHTGRLNVVNFGGYVSDGYMARLTDAGVLALTQSTNLPNLTCINLVMSGRLISKGWDSLLECERLASVEGDETALNVRFRERFPLSRAQLAGYTLLRLFPWSHFT
jgi:uncharacterized protein (TIGR02996 family)